MRGMFASLSRFEPPTAGETAISRPDLRKGAQVGLDHDIEILLWILQAHLNLILPDQQPPMARIAAPTEFRLLEHLIAKPAPKNSMSRDGYALGEQLNSSLFLLRLNS